MSHPEDLVMDPATILQQCHIPSTADVADFGCGPGIFSIPLAQITSGTVYCFDVLESALEAVKNRAYIMGINNIVTQRSNLEKLHGSGLKDGAVAHIVMRKILVQNDDKPTLFAEAFRVLQEKGVLLVVGWNDQAVTGFDILARLAPEKVVALAQETGFTDIAPIDAGKYHYAYAFTK